jgi:hypothetical protein
VANLINRSMSVGIEAIILSPRLADFNEDIRTLGIDALRAAIRVQIVPEDVARFMKSGMLCGTADELRGDAGILSRSIVG